MAQLKTKSKPKAKRRWWRILLVSVLGLVAFLLMFVAAFLFNPFEGTLPELRDIVPRGVNFYARKADLADDFAKFPEPKFWDALRNARGFDAVEAGSLGKWFRDEGLDRALDDARKSFEQVAADSGGFLDLMRDVIGREVIVAGYVMEYTANAPARPLAQPRWCFYTRVDWRVKAMLGAAGFGFVQSKLADNGLQVRSDGDLLVVKPQNGPEIFVKRELDVVMVANHTGLLEQSQRLLSGSPDEEPIGRMSAYTDGALARIDKWAEDNDVGRPNVLEFVTEPNAFDGFRRFAAGWPNPNNQDSMNERVLASFLNLNGWMQITGGLMFEDQVLAATGQIDLNSKQHTNFQSSFYQAEQERREKWLDPFLRMVPESACAAAALRVPAADFLRAMFDSLETDERQLINDALRRATFQNAQLNDFRDLVERMSSAFLSRAGFVFRKNTPDLSKDADGNLMVPVAAKSPMPQVAWVFWLRPGTAPLVEELVTMLRTYYQSFGFNKVWHLPVKFGPAGTQLPEPVTEFTSAQIPATGEIAMLVFRDFFVVSNSGPLVSDIVRTKYSSQTGMKSLRESPQFRAAEREFSQSLNGLIWVDGKNLEAVVEDYIGFAQSASATPDPEWMALTRPSAEDHVRRTKYPQYPSKAAMPRSLTEPGGAFDEAVVAYLRDRWTQTRTSFTANDRVQMQQLRGFCQLLDAAAIQLELQNNYIRYQARLTTRYR
ncbi:MAG: hypothetical protein R3F29_12770 [Planctomycetota bacterium]